MRRCLENQLLFGENNTIINNLSNIDTRALLIVTVGYIVTMLSVSLLNLEQLILFVIYPLMMATLSHVKYSRIFRQSLVVLPFVILVGVMNPLFDHRVAKSICGIDISAGWVSFLSIVIRGLLSVQAVLLLINLCSIDGVFRELRRIGVSQILVTQLRMVSRYISTLAYEAASMSRARQARGYGRRNYSVKAWSGLVGQLLLLTIEKGERIHRAMVARGFNNQSELVVNPQRESATLKTNSILFVLIWGGVIFCLRYFNLATLFCIH